MLHCTALLAAVMLVAQGHIQAVCATLHLPFLSHCCCALLWWHSCPGPAAIKRSSTREAHPDRAEHKSLSFPSFQFAFNPFAFPAPPLFLSSPSTCSWLLALLIDSSRDTGCCATDQKQLGPKRSPGAGLSGILFGPSDTLFAHGHLWWLIRALHGKTAGSDNRETKLYWSLMVNFELELLLYLYKKDLTVTLT